MLVHESCDGRGPRAHDDDDDEYDCDTDKEDEEDLAGA